MSSDRRGTHGRKSGSEGGAEGAERSSRHTRSATPRLAHPSGGSSFDGALTWTRRARQRRLRMDREDHRASRLLIEVEVGNQIAEVAGGVADVGSRIGGDIGRRVDQLPDQVKMIAALGIGIDAQLLARKSVVEGGVIAPVP